MDLHIRDRRCVTILLPSGSVISSRGAKLLVDYAQHRSGNPHWETIAVDQFPGNGETLLIARPAQTITVSIPEYVLPFLNNYFMD